MMWWCFALPAHLVTSSYRMLANAGYPVLELRRERYGDIVLGELPEGDHAPVSGEALEWAKSVFQLQPATAGNSDDREDKGTEQ